MAQSNEELLKERYKVVADYPGNKFTVGDIITYVREVAQTYDMWRNQNGVDIIYSSFHKYPHLFKKLEWWEDRKPEEMPEYLNCPSRKMFFKVESWHKSYFIIDGRQKMQYRNYIPATLAEYEQFVNQQKQTNGQDNR